MARPRKVAIDPDATFAEAARATLEVRGPAFLDHAAGVLSGEDIEDVHQMRVAGRRLRAVLEVYAACFDKKRHGKLLGLVKDTGDALSEARDLDVQIEWLTRYKEGAPAADRAGLRSLVGELTRRRDHVQEHIPDAIGRLESEDFAGQVARLVEVDS
jgi:CHAD domain-containing protein